MIPLPGTNAPLPGIVDALAGHAALRPSAPAFIDTRGEISYLAVLMAMRRGATWLARQGVRAGDLAAFAMDNSEAGRRRALELFYACAWLGVVVLPLFPDIPHLARIGLIVRFRAKWLLASGAPARVEGAWSLDPSSFDPADASLDDEPAPRCDRPDAPFYFLFTSGTTGNAKALLAAHGKLARNWSSYAQVLPVRPDERELSSILWPSSVGLRNMLRVHSAGGAIVCVPVGEGREEFGALLRRYRVTRVLASPWLLRRLLASPPPLVPLPALDWFNVVGAEITAEEIAAARASLTPNVQADYGSNEVGYISRIPPGDSMRRPGDVGRIIEGVQVRVEDDDGRLLPPGEVGLLGFHTPWMYTGYADQTQANAVQFRDGWFFPGDMGSVDDSGRLCLSGRADDVINFGGVKVWPAGIEAVLRQYPAVLDAALVGLPHPDAGQITAAFVVLRPEAPVQVSEAQLRQFCIARLDGARLPRLFFFVPSIVRNENGKLQRDALLAAYPVAVQMARAS